MTDLGARLRTALSGRYAVEEEIGRGGMSVVFRAIDIKHHRTVAIKVLRPELSQQIGADRFHQEVEFAASLNSPYILPLFDSGEADGCLFYLMPYVEGGSLADRIEQEGRLPVADALGIARNVAQALEVAHARGIVHRDIKPGNILFSGGEAVVADFGIARALAAGDGRHLTQSGVSVGSPYFMSPEQAAGDEVDERSDIYSLGCVLHTMLTGVPPFVRDTFRKTMTAHLTEPPPSVQSLRPDVTRGVGEIVATALEKRPEDRFSSAEEFSAALREPEFMPARAKSRRRRRQARTAAIATIAMVGVGYVGWRAFGPNPVPTPHANRVMVFPLQERGNAPVGSGLDAALVIGNALNYADPLNFVDGWTWLDAERRADVGRLTSRRARELALEHKARWYIGGTILGQGDSATVTLQLHDAVAGEAVARELATGGAEFAGIADAGLDATTRLLPTLLDPDREVDPAILAAARSSHPIAMLEWVQGEKAYRASRLGEALVHYQNALAADSAWAFAAMKAAQAASWARQDSLALSLLGRALEHADRLPPKYAAFARGLRGYLTGDPSLAVAGLEAALALDSSWAEPWTALGEVYYHIPPDWEGTDAVAESYFRRSLAADSSFAIPHFHLAQVALRRDSVERAELDAAALRRAGAEPFLLQLTELSIRCVRDNPSSVAWDSLARARADIVTGVGLGMANGLMQTRCADATFSALLADASIDEGWKRAASVATAFILLGQGRQSSALALFDSTVANGEPGNMGYYPLLAIAGYSAFDESAAEAIGYLPTNLAEANIGSLWFLGWWSHHQGDTERLREIVPLAMGAAAESSNPRDAGLAAGLAARLAATDGDTTRALTLLAANPPRSETRVGLEHEWDSPLPFSRHLLAELLLATGDYLRAIAVADGFDGRPRIYLPFVPRSLALRAEAAEAAGDVDLATAYRLRLTRLTADTESRKPHASSGGAGRTREVA